MFVFGQALLLAAAPPVPPPAVASTPTPLILDANRADRAPAPGPPSIAEQPGGAKATRVEAAPSGAPIRHIGFGGARVPASVAAVAGHFIGRPASRATLEALAKAMADAYAHSDVALYTVIVPAQRFDNGDVRILVAEGHVERVVFKRGRTPLLAAYAAALAAETPLTRPTMERYLSLMRDVPGRTIDVQLLRGNTPGGVILQIDAHAKRKDLTLTFDNRGASLLGEGQARLDGHAYSLLRDGDRTDLTGLVSPDFHRLRYVSLAHATPLGASGATLGASVGYIDTHPRHSIVDGEARTFGLSASAPLIRGYKRNLTLTLGLDGIDSNAAALGNLISSDHTRAARLAAGYSYAGAKSVFSAGATFSRGLDVLGARGPAGSTDIVFTKLNGRVSYDRAIGKHLVLRLRAAGQYSPDRLAAAERFAIGGADFGRAFDQALLSGDSGYAGAGELAWRPKLPAKFNGSELYGFLDGARVTIAARDPYASGRFDLASAGAGTRVSYGPRASFEVEGARAIDRAYPGARDGWRINFGWRLSLAKR